MQGVGNLAPYSFFNLMSCDPVSGTVLQHYCALLLHDRPSPMYLTARLRLHNLFAAKHPKSLHWLKVQIECSSNPVADRALHSVQPYVVIGAMTTRGRPNEGIKDSHQNINETGCALDVSWLTQCSPHSCPDHDAGLHPDSLVLTPMINIAPPICAQYCAQLAHKGYFAVSRSTFLQLWMA